MAERVAGILRERIMEGQFPPGFRLSEETIIKGLGISRNTLREAFRLLAHEKLLVHELNRGVFVRKLGTDDLSDLYRVRRVVECSALREITEIPKAAMDRLCAAVTDAEQAAFDERWPDVGTANLRFHEAIVSLIGSPRVDELMRRVWAELRLVWHVMENPRMIYEPYVAKNREILELLLTGDLEAAAKLLDAYLTDAEERLVAAYADASER
ncbi:MAG TPA: GntR family transcriptional regulator [Actinophytocola sp.]|nr:GntR family transcriptional regulator [Actinophytocola sp.]HEV2777898.1 GntR family transcriptional regulator [Actinophytocola sp.]